MNYEAERGYLIVAGSHQEVNYISCAETLAKSLRYWHPDVKICLLTDIDYDNTLFDFVKQFPYGNTGGWTTDWQVYDASPFHETIKLEADMVISGPVDHWWTHFQKFPVWISTNCNDYHGNISTNRTYRKLFDMNNLPDVYNAITYWRVSPQAKIFFNTVRAIFENWHETKTFLQGTQDENANTDLVYALCCSNYITPGYGPRITHMKSAILGTYIEDWTQELVWEVANGILRINGHNQSGFVHYQQKHLAPALGEYYGS
jgi:hypothetical protein